jgi:hypothetical protein
VLEVHVRTTESVGFEEQSENGSEPEALSMPLTSPSCRDGLVALLLVVELILEIFQ